MLTPGDLRARAMRGSVWALICVAVSLPLGIVANAVVARLLGPSEYGSLAFLLAFVTVAIPLSELGVGQALLQWGVSAETRGDHRATDDLLRARVGFALLAQVPLLWLAGAWILHDEAFWVSATYFGTSLMMATAAAAQSVLVLQNRTATAGKIATFVGIVLPAAIVIAAVLTHEAAPVWATRLVLSLLAPLAAIFVIGRRFRRVAFRPRLPRSMPPRFWRFALLSWVAGASFILVYSRSEVFVLRLYGKAIDLGLFALAFGLSQQLTALIDGLLAPLFPAHAGLLAADPGRAREAFLRSLRVFALLAGGLTALIPAIYLLTPLAFGQEFGRSAEYFLPLAIASTLQSATSPLILVSYARRRGGLLAGASVVALTLDIGVAIALIPSMGAWGAVVANIIGQVTSMLLLARGELATQGAKFKETAAAAAGWGLGLVTLVPTLAIGLEARSILGDVPSVAVALVAGVAIFMTLLRVAGGVLTASDANGLLEAFPVRLQGVMKSMLRPAIIRSARRVKSRQQADLG